MSAFRKATKLSARLRAAITGVSGSGKTYTSIKVACAMARALGGRVAVIDSERGSASKYAKEFDFDVLELATFHPDRYIEAIHDAERENYAVIVIDSLSHAWMGKEGALEQVDKATARSRSANSFGAWREVTPMHNALVDAMLRSTAHVIATVRSKTEWVLEQDSRGKQSPRKVGMAPVQRDGLEYEFDVFGDMDVSNTLVITKTRCSELNAAVLAKPGDDLAAVLLAWLSDGAVPEVPEVAAPPLLSAPALVELDEAELTKIGMRIDDCISITELNLLTPTLQTLVEVQREAMRVRWRSKAIKENWIGDKAKQRAKQDAARTARNEARDTSHPAAQS